MKWDINITPPSLRVNHLLASPLGLVDDYDLTSMTLVIPPPHVLGLKYERL